MSCGREVEDPEGFIFPREKQVPRAEFNGQNISNNNL